MSRDERQACDLCGGLQRGNLKPAYEAEMMGTYGNLKCAPGVGYYPGHRVSLCESHMKRVLEKQPAQERLE